MKLFKTICAASAALALGITAMSTGALADPASPYQIQAAYDAWQAAVTAHTNATDAYDAAEDIYNGSEDACWDYWVEGQSQPNYDAFLTCRNDADTQWWWTDEPALRQAVDDAWTDEFLTEGYYSWISNCGQTCF